MTRERISARVLALVAFIRAAALAGLGPVETDTTAVRRRLADSRGQTSTKAAAGGAAAMGAGGALMAGAQVAAEDGLVAVIKHYLIGGNIYVFALEIAETIGSLGDKFASPIATLLGGVSDIIGSTFTGSIIDRGATISGQSLWQWGLLAFPAAIAVTIGGVAILYLALARTDFSPIQLIFDKLPGR